MSKNTTAEATKTATKPTSNGHLTGRETEILTALSKSNKPLNRAELAKKIGMKKGWSKIMGSSTKADGGMRGSDSLTGRKLVKAEKHEGERSMGYTITAAGRKLLGK